MIVVLSIIGLLIIILLIGKVSLSIRFGKQVKQLFSNSLYISGKTFSFEQLRGLPEPVQRYFNHVLAEVNLTLAT